MLCQLQFLFTYITKKNTKERMLNPPRYSSVFGISVSPYQHATGETDPTMLLQAVKALLVKHKYKKKHNLSKPKWWLMMQPDLVASRIEILNYQTVVDNNAPYIAITIPLKQKIQDIRNIRVFLTIQSHPFAWSR